MIKRIERMTLSERRYQANVMLAEARRVIADRVIRMRGELRTDEVFCFTRSL